MPVPKTAINKNYQLVLGQYKIRSAWQVRAMQPEPIAQSMQVAADNHLWLGIFASDIRHHPGAGFYINYISQGVLRSAAHQWLE